MNTVVVNHILSIHGMNGRGDAAKNVLEGHLAVIMQTNLFDDV